MSAILTTIAVTNNRITKDSRPSVRIFKGKRIKTPMVALSKPITKATKIAVPKFRMIMVGKKWDSKRIMPAFTSNSIIKFITDEIV